jgi:hypothetical protein
MLVAGLAGFSAGWPAAAQHAQPDRLVAEAPTVDYRVDEQVSKDAWTLTREANPDIYEVALDRGEKKQVCFISGPNSLCRKVGIGESYDFTISHNGIDYPTRMLGTFIPPMAKFDAAYRAAHRGKIRLDVPEVYELVNIAIALTPKAQEERFLVAKDTPYFEEVQRDFAGVKDHPFVLALDKEMRLNNGRYPTLKMNAYSFIFGKDGRIVQSLIYDRTGFNGSRQNDLRPHLPLMQDFADKSGFRTFYAKHKPLYQSQIDYYRKGVDLDGMVAWLRANFPAVKPYDTTNIIFSPLVAANQSVTWMESNGFRELQPHINFPYRRPTDDQLSPQSMALRHGYIAFTELNHGFINPTAEPFEGRIVKALDQRAYWTVASAASEGYPTAISVFNEMMNWGLIALYLLDKAPAADLETMLAGLDKTMGPEGRGFRQSPRFQRFLVDLYRSRPAGATVADLYPKIVEWFEAQDDSQAPAAATAGS